MKIMRFVLRWVIVIAMSALFSLTILNNLDDISKKFFTVLSIALLHYLTKIIWNKIGWNINWNN